MCTELWAQSLALGGRELLGVAGRRDVSGLALTLIASSGVSIV